MTDEQPKTIDELIAAEKREALEHFRAGAAGVRLVTRPRGPAARHRRLLFTCAGLAACAAFALVVAHRTHAPAGIDPTTVQRALARARVFEPPTPATSSDTRDRRTLDLEWAIEAALWQARRHAMEPPQVEALVLAALEGRRPDTHPTTLDGTVDEADLARRIERLEASGRLERLLVKRSGV